MLNGTLIKRSGEQQLPAPGGPRTLLGADLEENGGVSREPHGKHRKWCG